MQGLFAGQKGPARRLAVVEHVSAPRCFQSYRFLRGGFAAVRSGVFAERGRRARRGAARRRRARGAKFGLHFCQLAAALGNFRFRRRTNELLRRGTAAASCSTQERGAVWMGGGRAPRYDLYGFWGRGRRTSTRPARRDTSDERLGRRVRRPAERLQRLHRSARRRTARGAAREADGSGDDRTQGRAAAPPAGGRRRRARSRAPQTQRRPAGSGTPVLCL